jgi:polysaccharide deacetylase family protein (PEP-CTERM system associated)
MKETTGSVLNCFSVDVEGFVESNEDSFPIPASYKDPQRERIEIERNMDALLRLLSDSGVRGTFFFVGRIARDMPELLRLTSSKGHELGLHSYEHRRIWKTTADTFARGIREAKDRIEQLSGVPVAGFRAPDFSITAHSLWALDALRETGFLYDSSIYPIGIHDVYGIPDAQPGIHRLENGLVEFPLSTASLAGRRFPFGGGGYFRLFPLFISMQLLKHLNRRNEPGMFYIHPYEVGPSIPRIRELSLLRQFRHYYNCASGAERIARLFRQFRFGAAIDILKDRGYINEGMHA